MEWPFDETGEYRHRLIEFKDFSGTTIRESRLNGVRLVGVEMTNSEIDGYLEHLVVNGVDVVPLVEAELDRRYPVRVLGRSDEPDDLRAAWAELGAQWDTVVARARALPESRRHEQVNGEWSVTQTLRHLVFVIDSWFSHVVMGDPLPYHAAGLPAAFMTGTTEMGIDTAASPSFDEAAAIWHDRHDIVGGYLASATSDDLVQMCEPTEDPYWPVIGAGTTAIRCLRVVFDETWAHHQFAVRDLAILEAGASGPR